MYRWRLKPPPLLGPHFYWDVIRLARKGRTTLLRCLYLVVLLIGIWVLYGMAPIEAVNHNDFARRAQDIAVTVIGLQYFMVIVLTPVLVSGAIVEEKERRTLELLF